MSITIIHSFKHEIKIKLSENKKSECLEKLNLHHIGKSETGKHFGYYAFIPDPAVEHHENKQILETATDAMLGETIVEVTAHVWSDGSLTLEPIKENDV